MEQNDRRYFFTAGIYYDCPTCDSVGYGEDIYISPYFNSKEDLLDKIKEMIPEYFFYSIGCIEEDGKIISLVNEVENKNSWHNVQYVKFTLEGTVYKFNNVGLMTTETEVKDVKTD